MTIMQSARRAKPAIDDDPWLSIDQLLEKYPFLQGRNPDSRRRIYRLRDLGHFPQHDGRAGRLLLWLQSTIEAWLEGQRRHVRQQGVNRTQHSRFRLFLSGSPSREPKN